MWTEFKDFLIKTNVLSLALAFIIGVALAAVVISLVNDIIMPPIGLILARVDFANLFWDLSGTHHATLEEAKKAGAATISYGVFLNNIIDFIIVAFVIFLVVRQANKMRRQPDTVPNTKECPYCASAIALKAKRCPNCTSQLE